MKIALCLFLFIISMDIYSANFTVGPQPTNYESGGTVFFVQNDPGTYDISLTIYDAPIDGSVQFSSKCSNFVVSDAATRYPFETWNLTNINGRKDGAGTYYSYLTMVNTLTGAIYNATHNVGVRDENNSPLSIIKSSNGDNIIQSKVTPSTKAIILLEGNDAMNQYFARNLEGKFQLIGDIPGYDFFLVDWKDAGVSIYTNAQNTVSIIQQLVSTYRYTEIVLIGKSMGGVVGRLALAKAETDGLYLPVKKFISLDAPQQGGQINFTAQASVYSICNSFPDWFVPLDHQLVTASMYKDRMLDIASSKEMLYYHAGLVGNQIQYLTSALQKDVCALDPSNLDAIRAQATVWHDNFYSSLKNYGNIYGYPKFCKNYAISYSNGNLIYTGKVPNQYIADFSPVNYHLFSDKEDLNPGDYLYSKQISDEVKMKDGYSSQTVFIPLESALDLRYMDYAKTKGLFNRNLTYEEMSSHSPFDKIYIKSTRVDHMTAIDGELLSFIRDAINDNTPKTNKILPSGSFIPILNLLFNQ